MRKPTADDWEVVLSIHGMIKGQAQKNYPFMATRPRRQIEEDLLLSFEIGQMAAIKAAVAWDRRVRFSTWAYRPIVWRIRRYWQSEEQRKRNTRVMPAMGKRNEEFNEEAFVWNGGVNSQTVFRDESFENVELVETLIAKLKPKQQKVVRMYFGIGVPERNICQMCSVTRLTRERNRQILGDALDALRFYMNKMKLNSWEVLG